MNKPCNEIEQLSNKLSNVSWESNNIKHDGDLNRQQVPLTNWTQPNINKPVQDYWPTWCVMIVRSQGQDIHYVYNEQIA